MSASSVLWQHLRILQLFEWQRSHLFFSFDSYSMREDHVQWSVYVCECTGVCKCTQVRVSLLDKLEICCRTTVSDLVTNNLNWAQAAASPRVSHMFNGVFSCSPPQPRSPALQNHYFALRNLSCLSLYVWWNLRLKENQGHTPRKELHL